jgi:hypothetical protein
MYCSANDPECKKIILTTDQDLIKDGVQAIPDEFLEWFVKNPSCEEVEVEKDYNYGNLEHFDYKIIIPKDKQLFTDYPITELGDEEFKEAPIRQCELISYDDNKYCYVKVEGIEKEIKRCYIYPQKGRCGEVDCISNSEIKMLLKEEPKQETIYEYTENYKPSFVDLTDILPKQETLEEVADRLYPYEVGYGVFDRNCEIDIERQRFVEGAEWQQEQDKNKYSEEELRDMLQSYVEWAINGYGTYYDWFEKFKKK